MKSDYIYILKCNDGSYYTGITNNLERRIREHENGQLKGCYTQNRRPVTLAYFEKYYNVNNAITREKQLKGWSRKKKEALISENFERLSLLSKNYTQYR